jgi:tetratricopeptide (TPR) repeat protein
MRTVKILFVLPAVLIWAGCSSLPGRPTEILSIRNTAESQLVLANNETDRGNYEAALELLEYARRSAVSADDPGLMVRIGLSLGNTLFAQGHTEEAGTAWDKALEEAERWKYRELAAVCRITILRGRLLLALQEPGAALQETARQVRDEVRRQMDFVDDKHYAAFGWTLVGLAEKEMGRYSEAEAALRRSLSVHEKEHYLEEAAYDWFLIGSVRSAAGDYDGAREALMEAVGLDRRVENSWGLAADWRALGDIHKKAGRQTDAESAYRRSAEIYRSIGLDDAALEAESRIN